MELHPATSEGPFEDKRRRLETLLGDIERMVNDCPAPDKAETHRPVSPLAKPLPHLFKKTTPANDECSNATAVGLGDTLSGFTTGARRDGAATCGSSLGSPDVWFRFSAEESGHVAADLFASDYDTTLSVHRECPGSTSNEVICNDDRVGLSSAVGFHATAGTTYYFRVSGFNGTSGAFDLRVGPGGSVEGRVTALATGEPLAGGQVKVRRTSLYMTETATTQSDGGYSMNGLEPDTYWVWTDSFPGIVEELHEGVPCPEGSCPLTLGETVKVGSNGNVTVDFALGAGGSIAGAVRDAAGDAPVEGAELQVFNEGGAFLEGVLSDRLGAYEVGGLPSGLYFLRAVSPRHLSQTYDGLPSSVDPVDGTPVAVIEPGRTEGTDFLLDRLGGISGAATDANTGQPLSGVLITVWNPETLYTETATTDAAGLYSIGGLHAGEYLATARSSTYGDEAYDDVDCPRGLPQGCDESDATPIAVTLNNMTTGIDFALLPLGAITGRVTDALSGEGVSGVRVLANRLSFYYPTRLAVTGADGRYLLEALEAGDDWVVSTRSSLADEVYDNQPCEATFGGCAVSEGTRISVALNSTTAGIDFALDHLGSISGVVTEEVSGGPLGGAEVVLTHEGYDAAVTTFSDATGRYVFPGLSGGAYRVYVRGRDFLDELFDDVACEQGCDPMSGTPVVVELNQDTPGIDFTVSPGGVISGKVTTEATGEPVSTHVQIYDDSGRFLRNVQTETSGEYRVSGLLSGCYILRVGSSFGFVDEVWNSVLCTAPCDVTTGTPVPVTVGQSTGGIDFSLKAAGSISGRVTDAVSGDPVGVSVRVYNAGGGRVGEAETDAIGNYTVMDLPPGDLFVETRSYSYFIDEIYADLPCNRTCEPTTGTPVVVNVGMTTGGIDFALDRMGELVVTLLDVTTAEPVVERVTVFNRGDWVASGRSELDGKAHFRLFAGTYFVNTESFQHYDEIYDDILCLDGQCDPRKGTPVEVAPNAATEMTMALIPIQSRGIAGRVKDAAGRALEGVTLNLWDETGGWASSVTTLTTGEYFLPVEGVGTYFVSTSNDLGFVDEVWEQAGCVSGDCDPTTGQAIAVGGSAATVLVIGIDFHLGGAVIFADGFESGDLSGWL